MAVKAFYWPAVQLSIHTLTFYDFFKSLARCNFRSQASLWPSTSPGRLTWSVLLTNALKGQQSSFYLSTLEDNSVLECTANLPPSVLTVTCCDSGVDTWRWHEHISIAAVSLILQWMLNVIQKILTFLSHIFTKSKSCCSENVCFRCHDSSTQLPAQRFGSLVVVLSTSPLGLFHCKHFDLFVPLKCPSEPRHCDRERVCPAAEL